ARPDGDATDEVARAVDGIDDPAKAGLARLVAKFLAQEPVVGKRFEERRADYLFRLAVGNGHGRLVLFPLDGQAAVEVTEGDGASLPRGFLGGFIAGTPLRIHERPPFLLGRRRLGRKPFSRSRASAHAASSGSRGTAGSSW